jgi:hypothetical protein
VLTAVRAARDATSAAQTRETVRPWYEFNTPTGSVQFSRRIMWFYPAPIGWARLQRLHSAGSNGQTALYKVGLTAWTAYGPPRITGGDLGFTLFYNVATTTFTILSPHQLAGLAITNGGNGILTRGAELGSGIAALGAGWRTGSNDDDETANEARVACRDALVNAGAIVGLAASGSAGAVGGKAEHDVTNESVGAVLGSASDAGLSIGILLGGDNADGFAAALCGGSVDVDPPEHLHVEPPPAALDVEVWSDTSIEHEVAVVVEKEVDEPTAVPGDALGLISNFFATARIPRCEPICGAQLRAPGRKRAAAQVASRCDS